MAKCRQLFQLALATFIVIVATDFIIHGKILSSMYIQTQGLWRSAEDMQHMKWCMFGGRALVSLFSSWIFMLMYKGGGIIEGLAFGYFIAGMRAGHSLIMHAVMPYPLQLTLAWIILGTIQWMICGIVLALLSGKRSTT